MNFYCPTPLKDNEIKEVEVEKAQKLPIESQSINNFIESCIQNVGKDSILFISEHGGYYDLPSNHYSDFGLNIPYYFYENLPFNPTQEEVERQLSSYMNENLFFCLRNFAEFRRLGYNIEFGCITTKNSILPDKLIFDLNMPIKIKKEDATIDIGRFNANLENIGLGKIIQLNNLILKEQAKNPYSVCISCILNWTINLDLQVNIDRVKADTILFKVTDNKTIINQKPLEFIFVNKYEVFSCSNLPLDDIDFVQQCSQQKIQNLTPELKIQKIPDFMVKAGETFFFDINASGINLIFEDFTDLFEINERSGIINLYLFS